MRTANLLMGLSVIFFLTGCDPKIEPEEEVVSSGSWTTGQTKTYTPPTTANSTVKDELTGNTFAFPDGGNGTLIVTKVVSGPATTAADNAFSVSYSGTGKVKLVVPGKLGENLCIGYAPIYGYKIMVDEGHENNPSVWIPLPERDNGNNTVSFELPLAKSLKDLSWQGISTFKTIRYISIKDYDEKFRKMVTDVANTIVKAMPASMQQPMKDKISGNLLPGIYVNKDVDLPCYKPFWDYFGFVKRELFMFKTGSNINNVAHEFGHYIHHYLTDSYYTNFANSPRGSKHAVGESGAKNNIIEEPAYLTEFYCLGKISNAWDPEDGTFCVERRESGGKNSPATDDFLDLEGFGIMLMASVIRTSTTIPNYKGTNVEVPVIKPEQTDRTSFFQDMYAIFESGENSIDGIIENIVALAEYKYGGKNNVKKLSAMWQPLGYTYSATCKFVDKSKNALSGVTAMPYIKLSDGKEYKLPENKTASKDGLYTIPENFPGTSSLRISYTNAAGEKKSVDLENGVVIDWTQPTNKVAELGEIVIDDQNILADLHKTIVAAVQFEAMFSTTKGNTPLKQLIDNNSSGTALTWSGQGFAITKKWTSVDGPFNTYEKNLSISGTVSKTGTVVENCTSTYELKWYEGAKLLRTTKTTITCNNVPLYSISADKKKISFILLGSNVLGKAFMTYSEIWYDATGITTNGILWNDLSVSPTIAVVFMAP